MFSTFSYLLAALCSGPDPDSCLNPGPQPHVEPFNPTVLNGMETGAIPGFRFAGKSLGDLLSPTSSSFSLPMLIFFVAGVFFVINIVAAGFALMTSQGQPAGFDAAKTRFTNSIAGLLLVITAYWIVQAIGLVLKLQGITDVFGQ